MKLSTPSWQVLQEYLLVNGFEWVKETYNLTDDLIESLLYGGALPTEESNQKKIDKAFKEDEGMGDKRMLSMYFRDHFIWDEPNSKHKKCINSVEDGITKNDPFFIEKIVSLYDRVIRYDMSKSKNGMSSHGWCHGERVINQSTGKTSDDVVQDVFLRMIEDGKIAHSSTVIKWVVRDFEHGLNKGTEKITDKNN